MIKLHISQNLIPKGKSFLTKLDIQHGIYVRLVRYPTLYRSTIPIVRKMAAIANWEIERTFILFFPNIFIPLNFASKTF